MLSCQGAAASVAFVAKWVVEGSGRGLKDKHFSGPHLFPGPPERPDRIPQLTQLADFINNDEENIRTRGWVCDAALEHVFGTHECLGSVPTPKTPIPANHTESFLTFGVPLHFLSLKFLLIILK